MGILFISIPAVVFKYVGFEFSLVFALCEILTLQVASMEEIRDLRERVIDYLDKQEKK